MQIPDAHLLMTLGQKAGAMKILEDLPKEDGEDQPVPSARAIACEDSITCSSPRVD